jgi:rubrerythrin
MSEVFDFAMQMELDGKAYYEKEAAQTESPALKKILTGLAEDEERHFNIFKKLKEQHASDLGELGEMSTGILSTVKNVFNELADKKEPVEFKQSVNDVWKQAQDVEKKSEDFYRQKAEEVTNDIEKDMLIKIANEERRHWGIIEMVIQYINQPKTWLEDAEWNNPTDF